MVVAQERQWQHAYLANAKSFLVWSFTLTVCLLVVGFPIIFLAATIAVLAAIVLQFVLPVSAVLVVTGSVLALHILMIFVGAAVLTLRGIHPEEVEWLHWLHGEKPHASVFASCPLTCDLETQVS